MKLFGTYKRKSIANSAGNNLLHLKYRIRITKAHQEPDGVVYRVFYE